MNGFWRTARLVVSVVVLIAASYYVVVAVNNVTNPASNWVFVKGVMSLQGVPAGSGFGWRAITATPLQIAVYVAIVAGEATAAALLAVGGVIGLRRRAAHTEWLSSQRWTLLGCGVGLAVFFFGFMVLGGNWWVMYLNGKWNGLDAAFQNSTLTFLTLVAVIGVAIGGGREE